MTKIDEIKMCIERNRQVIEAAQREILYLEAELRAEERKANSEKR